MSFLGGKINEGYCLENLSNLYVKIVTKIHVANLVHFQEKNYSYFFLQKERHLEAKMLRNTLNLKFNR